MSAEKCPNCGGEVQNGKCLYCDSQIKNNTDGGYAFAYKVLKFEEMKKNEAAKQQKKQKEQAIIAVVIIALIMFGLIGISFFTIFSNVASDIETNRDYENRNEIIEIVTENQYTEFVTEAVEETIDVMDICKQKGRWTSGMYQIGKDIPEGTYLVMTDGQASELFPMSLHTTAEGRDDDNFIGETWASFSRYITITEPGFIDVSWSVVYDIEKNDVENDPHKHSGMFLVGRDIEPGTYQLTFDHFYDDFDRDADYAKYHIYSDVDAVAPVIRETGDFEEGMEITLEEGDFLKLEECLIKE